MRLIAVGDIHGEYDKLLEVMESVQPTEDDQIVFLGDYIDRGPKIVETLVYLMDFQQRFPKTVFLKGNHEEMMMGALRDENYATKRMWLQNGGGETTEQIVNSGHAFSYFTEWLHDSTVMSRIIDTEAATYYFSHAGWDPSLPLGQQVESPDPEYLLWSRDHLHPDTIVPYIWTDGTAVFGHTPLTKPLVSSWGIGIDTGAVYGYMLTAAELPLRKEQEVVFHASSGGNNLDG